MSKKISVLLSCGLFAVAGGADCIQFPFGCTPSVESGVVVRVTNADTAEGITGAMLTLTEGDYSELLTAPTSPSGSYTGADERPGTYTLTIVAAGFTGRTLENVVVALDSMGCHVVPVNLSVELTPNN